MIASPSKSMLVWGHHETLWLAPLPALAQCRTAAQIFCFALPMPTVRGFDSGVDDFVRQTIDMSLLDAVAAGIEKDISQRSAARDEKSA